MAHCWFSTCGHIWFLWPSFVDAVVAETVWERRQLSTSTQRRSLCNSHLCKWPNTHSLLPSLPPVNAAGVISSALSVCVCACVCLCICPVCALKPWLHVKYNYFEIILKFFQCLISHVTTVGGFISHKAVYTNAGLLYLLTRYLRYYSVLRPTQPSKLIPSPPPDNIWVLVIVWRLRGHIIIWPVKIVPEMTYNVLSRTLSLYTTTTPALKGMRNE